MRLTNRCHIRRQQCTNAASLLGKATSSIQSFDSISDTFSVIHIHNKFTIKNQRRDEKDMLEAI